MGYGLLLQLCWYDGRCQGGYRLDAPRKSAEVASMSTRPVLEGELAIFDQIG
jgi:hypothetical protein